MCECNTFRLLFWTLQIVIYIPETHVCVYIGEEEAKKEKEGHAAVFLFMEV